MINSLKKKYNLSFSDFLEAEGLQRIIAGWALIVDQDILATATQIESLLISLFNLEHQHKQNTQRAVQAKKQYLQKRIYVQKRAKAYQIDSLTWSASAYLQQHFANVSTVPDGRILLDHIERHASDPNTLTFAAWLSCTTDGQRFCENSPWFQLQKTHTNQPTDSLEHSNNTYQATHTDRRLRQGFECTQSPTASDTSLNQAHQCLKCHVREKDSCRFGLEDTVHQGCPLNIRISEMIQLYEQGQLIAALAVLLKSNPLALLTGHRICNDCSRACIFQKQDAVDIPYIESQIVQDALKLPYGFEIYCFLVRWNPFSASQLSKSLDSRKALVVGTGPAGAGVALGLLMNGHQVHMIDGQRIKSLDSEYTQYPIHDISTVMDSIAQHPSKGFGGVADYGITARWDKNNLKLARILLARFNHFSLSGSTRFGSQITSKIAQKQGYSHIAVCAGAGQPIIPDIQNIMAKGVHFASDFLMALHSCDRIDEFMSFDLHLPSIIIGGGLTAIDTATEVRAYYVQFVRRIHELYTHQCAEFGTTTIRSKLAATDLCRLDTYLSHAQGLKDASPVQKDLLIDQWGGVKILYRRDLNQSPSVTLNFHEVFEAFKEGIQVIDHHSPKSIITDNNGWCQSITAIDSNHQAQEIPARSVFIATGTNVNTHSLVDGLNISKDKISTCLQSLNKQNFMLDNADISVSIHGDMHPAYKGSVVKALASAQNGVPDILSRLSRTPQHCIQPDNQSSRVLSYNQVSRFVYRLEVFAPSCVMQHQPGHIYKAFVPGQSTPYILTGADCDKIAQTMVFYVFDRTTRSQSLFKPHIILDLMGPSGQATHIPSHKHVLLIGGGLGNAALYSIARAMQQRHCHVTTIAAYPCADDVFDQSCLEQSSDSIIWCFEDSSQLTTHRATDHIISGCSTDALGHESIIQLQSIEHVLVIGPAAMLAALHPQLEQMGSDVTLEACVCAPMQCMMKEICGRCLQAHIDPDTGKEAYIFSCAQQDQSLKTLSLTGLFNKTSHHRVSQALFKDS